MLVILGGIKGNGRKTLARALAAAQGMHLYDLDRHKLQQGVHDGKGKYRQRATPIRADNERMRIIQTTIDELPMLSKLYGDVIVTGPLHRVLPRETLLAAAKKIFSPVVFVWVDSSDADAVERIQTWSSDKRDGRDVERVVQERIVMKNDFQELQPGTAVFLNEPSVGVDDLWNFIRALR